MRAQGFSHTYIHTSTYTHLHEEEADIGAVRRGQLLPSTHNSTRTHTLTGAGAGGSSGSWVRERELEAGGQPPLLLVVRLLLIQMIQMNVGG